MAWFSSPADGAGGPPRSRSQEVRAIALQRLERCTAAVARVAELRASASRQRESSTAACARSEALMAHLVRRWESAAVDAWVRQRAAAMLADGWTPGELAEVGIDERWISGQDRDRPTVRAPNPKPDTRFAG